MNTATFLLYVAPVLLVALGAAAYWLTGRADVRASHHPHPGE